MISGIKRFSIARYYQHGKKTAAVICILLVAACAGSGSISWDQARQLKIGMTEAELVHSLGRPYSVVSKADGTQLWIWVNATALGSAQSLSVGMKDRKVHQVPIIPDSFR